MKQNIVLKILVLFALFSFLTSCYVTRAALKNDNQYLENFNKVLVSQKNSQVIFPSSDGEYFYIVPDQDGTIEKLALWPYSKEIKFDVDYGIMEMKGSDFDIPYFILATSKTVTDQKQIDFLKNIGFSELGSSRMEKDKYVKNYAIKNCKRIGANDRIVADYQAVEFDLPYQATFSIKEETLLQKLRRMVILPFAVAADVVLAPITIPVWLITKNDESTTH